MKAPEHRQVGGTRILGGVQCLDEYMRELGDRLAREVGRRRLTTYYPRGGY